MAKGFKITRGKLLALFVASNILGYPLWVSFFSAISDSSYIPIMFRVFIVLFTILLLINSKKCKPKTSIYIGTYFVFLIAIIYRQIWDLVLFPPVHILDADKLKIFMFSFFVILLPSITIFLNFNKINKTSLERILTNYSVLFVLFSIRSFLFYSSGRFEANLFLDAISTALYLSISSILILRHALTLKNNASQIRYIILFFIALYLILKTGSRGPIISLIVGLLYVFNKTRRRLMSFSSLAVMLIAICYSRIKSIVHSFSSELVLFERLQSVSDGKDDSLLARLKSYDWFLDHAFESPLFGVHFARLEENMFPGYSHNLFVDIFYGWGVIGLAMFSFVIYGGFRLMKVSKQNCWYLCLFFLMFFTASMFSGAFYMNGPFMISILLILASKDFHYVEKGSYS